MDANTTTEINGDLMKSLVVLYVEDEDDVRDALSRYLSRRFAKVDTAANGQEGLDKFKQNHYDIVITDVRMPVMDGLEMAKQIKEITEDMPVIVVTAFNETDYFMRAIEIGIDRYVKKPVDAGELFEAIYKSTRVHFQQKTIEQGRKHMLDLLEQTVATLARAIEMRDPYTDGHQKRVAYLAVAIAEELGLPEESIRGIRLAALIHDIGKINIPLEILSRPGKLDATEFELIKRHPAAGYDVVGDINFPWPIRQIILEHHEKWNGSGYPNGLKGDKTLLEARIICVADVVEAMASHRPYRPGLGIDAATAEIKANSGILFDPLVVDACIKVIEREGVEQFWHTDQ
jgi:putative two-component system response regulator